MYQFEPDPTVIGTSAKDFGSQNAFHIQTSLLYTNESRQRMLRVHNYAVKSSRDVGDIYASIDPQTLISAMVRRKLSSFVSTIPLIDIQLEMVNEFKRVFKGVASQTSAELQGQLLPHLALGFLGVLKSPVFQAHYINNCEIRSQKQQR